MFILSVHVRDGVLEANEDTAGDADDEDEAEDDEGGHHNQDEKSVVLVRGAETRGSARHNSYQTHHLKSECSSISVRGTGGRQLNIVQLAGQNISFLPPGRDLTDTRSWQAGARLAGQARRDAASNQTFYCRNIFSITQQTKY